MEIYGCGSLEVEFIFIEVNCEGEGVVGEWQTDDGTHIILLIEGFKELAKGRERS